MEKILLLLCSVCLAAVACTRNDGEVTTTIPGIDRSLAGSIALDAYRMEVACSDGEELSVEVPLLPLSGEPYDAAFDAVRAEAAVRSRRFPSGGKCGVRKMTGAGGWFYENILVTLRRQQENAILSIHSNHYSYADCRDPCKRDPRLPRQSDR